MTTLQTVSYSAGGRGAFVRDIVTIAIRSTVTGAENGVPDTIRFEYVRK